MDFRAGSRLMDNSMSLQKLPGAFSELLGIEIEDYGIIEEAMPNGIRFSAAGDGEAEARISQWYDVIELNEAEAIASYTSNYFAGLPAVTRRAYGEGTAFYIGTEPDMTGIRKVLDIVVEEAGVQPVLPNVPEGIEAAPRSAADGRELIFVINHQDGAQTLPLADRYVDLITDQELSGQVELAPQDVLVLRKI
jgi:beta-galactosidase